MVDLNPRLKKLITEKIDSDLEDVVFHPYGKEIWLLTPNDKNWFFMVDCEGTGWFNQIFFTSFFHLFSMNSKEYSPFLKEWFEKKTSIPIRKLSRKNTNYDYMIDGVLNRNPKEYDWTLSKRWGFSYPTVKKYLDTKKKINSEEVKLRDLL